jgi:hypothetical protein
MSATKITFSHNAINKHRDLAEKIRENLEIDGVTIKEKEVHGAYNANLPEGLTPEMVKDLSRYNSAFHSAAYVAVAETAAEMFAANQEATRINAQLGYNAQGDQLNMTVDRSVAYPNPKAKEEGQPEKILKQLVVSSSVDLRGTSTKSLRNALSAEFENYFAK